MNRYDHQWQKLTALARQARDGRDLAAPFGFSTRVTTRAAATPAIAPWAAFERFALRGLVVAAVFSLGAMAFNYSTILTESADEYATTDLVDEMLDLS